MDSNTMDPNAALSHVAMLVAREETAGRPPVYKAIGISLAVLSGVFIGVSFVIKKIGLLKANQEYHEEAGEGYGYLKNVWWWIGMTLMTIGELCNFVAYAFVDAILVTPLGAISVVITTILSAIFLEERLSFMGKIGCFCSILGTIIITTSAPEQSFMEGIQGMQYLALRPAFLGYTAFVIAGAIFMANWAGPRYGKSSMFIYISICSMIGGLSVVATQGLGSAILAQINGENQLKHRFFYVLWMFVTVTLLTQVIFLNKALNLFNTALVTPTYYVMFTTATIITSTVLFQGFKGTALQITAVAFGFLLTCAGVVMLQLSKSETEVSRVVVYESEFNRVLEAPTTEEPRPEFQLVLFDKVASMIPQIWPARNAIIVTDETRPLLST